MIDEQKQKYITAKKEYKKNMTDEQKQKQKDLSKKLSKRI